MLYLLCKYDIIWLIHISKVEERKAKIKAKEKEEIVRSNNLYKKLKLITDFIETGR